MENPHLIHEDGSIEEVLPKNGNSFELHELYKLLNCSMIETMTVGKKKIMIIDEEGKFTGKDYNEKATEMMGYTSDFIVGKVLVTPIKYFK